LVVPSIRRGVAATCRQRCKQPGSRAGAVSPPARLGPVLKYLILKRAQA
jgi:hypothetical protein